MFDYYLEQIHGILDRACQSVTTRNLADIIKFMRSHDGIDPAKCVLHLDATLMATSGHVSRKMIEHYSHIRTAAKRRATEPLVDGM